MPERPPVQAPSRGGGVLASLVLLVRRSWRQLTSMRTALVLLFLLAVAAVPGSLLPQRRVNVEKVRTYLAEHPKLGPWLDRAYGFDVYASPWFSAIYLLLMVSLVGCLVPRLRSHLTALLRRPPEAPLRLSRLPAYAEIGSHVDGGRGGDGGRGVGGGSGADGGRGVGGGSGADGEVDVSARLRSLLRRRRFRVVVRSGPGGVTLSAEKGYLKETGNLLFHFALLALLVGVAAGSTFGWHANRLLVAGPDGAFCNSLQQYDEYGLGAGVGGVDLPPFCLRLDDFRAEYLDNGQPTAFHATVTVRTPGTGADAGSVGDSNAGRTRQVSVNDPLRLDGTNVYLLGHGYASILRYTDARGRSQTVTAPLLPKDSMLTSEGVALFPDAAGVEPGGAEAGGAEAGSAEVGGDGDAEGRSDVSQIGFTVLYLPTVPADPSAGRSAHPAERDPRVMLQAYRGNLGLDSGTPLSVYELDRRQLATGRLAKYGQPQALRVGESWKLPDGSSVEFLGTKPWVSLSVRHDPGEPVVLVGAVLLLIGLVGSLSGRRRRVWFRLADGRVTAGGLPRSDYPGFRTEFDAIVADAREALAADAHEATVADSPAAAEAAPRDAAVPPDHDAGEPSAVVAGNASHVDASDQRG